MKIAVIGAGISGLSSAYRLVQAGADVTLFEAGSYFGGHSNTVDVDVDGFRFGVDTGFLVFNQRTYPKLIALFEELGVESVGSDMSFSVKLPLPGRTLEWAGSNLDTVFAQRRNLFNPRFLGMVRDILRFNKEATALATGAGPMPAQSLGAFLAERGYSDAFRNWYLLPMAACIWSCPAGQMLAFPAATFIRFCHNHGLLQVSDRPQWRTVRGGSRVYVDKMLAAIPSRRLVTPVRSVTRAAAGGARSVRVDTGAGAEQFDQVVLACHSDQALALLGDARDDERALLGAIGYQPNRAVLHTDASCLPENRRAWSAWNYQSTASATPEVCVHYLINKLQPLPCSTPVIVSLNPIDQPDPRLVLGEFDYAHPVFDAAAVAAQGRLQALQGVQGTWFAGAWTGYGFHEDGLASGLAVAAALAARMAGQGDAAA
ncbi:NAD(P)/FAD-dependent oxidoreductase [Massilia soli]|uniref:FAD-dependent oxidoreductase n=1 Tax=Massilia soli TaxID=2792854 RepID=A0ABS7SSD1_9BURK|nr:FAD-dependent oxidoreductase [Massilia soli]MBZ2208844.1 FAD-dependent oxidoreductase [Massilia soli]